MAFNEKDNEKLGLILSTVGASIGNWAISQKSMQSEANGENDAPLDFDSLKRAICQAVDMLRMFPGFKAPMPRSSSSQAVAQVESEATILFPSRFRSPNGDSVSSFEATSLVSSSCRFSDDENSNSSPATASSSEADMGVSTSESQEKIDIKQESYAPLEKEPNDNQNIVSETTSSEEDRVTKSETSVPEPEVPGSPSKDKTPTKQRQRTNSSSSSSSWCVTPLRKRHWCNQVDDYDDYEDSERTREHRLSNKKSDADTSDEVEEGEWVEKKSKSLSGTEWDDESVNSPKSKKFRTADTGLNGTSNVLYVANFSLKTTSEDLKALSPDIREVRIISVTRFHRIGFLEFDSNEKAVENLKRLSGKILAGQQLFLRVSHSKRSLSTSAEDDDYRHRKSSKNPMCNEEKKSGDKRNSLYILHLANLSSSVTTHDLKKKFSDSEWVFIYKPNGCQTLRASILYSDEIMCKKAKNAAFGMKLKGRQIYASYGLYTGNKDDESVTGRSKDLSRSRSRSRSRSLKDEPLKRSDLRKLLLKEKDFERSPKADKIESTKKSSDKVPYRRVILPSELLKIYK